MAVKKFNTRIQLKNDTSLNWSNANLTLLAGEFAWDSTNNNFKIGSGSWNSLNYAIPVADESTIVSQVGDSKFKTLSIGSIGTDKVTSLAGYSLGSTTYSALATTDTLNQALAKLEAGVNAAATSGVQSIGGATGVVTLGNGLTSTSGANGSVSTLVNGYIVNNAGTNTNALDIDPNKIDSTYVMGNSSHLATISTVTAAINTLDGNITGTPGTGKTPVSFSQTDGIVTASFADISITSSQISDLSSNAVTSVTGDNWISANASVGAVTLTHSAASNPNTAATATIGTGNTGASTTFNTVTYSFDNTGHVNGHTTTTNTIIFPSAADLGLSGAMHFKGSVVELPTPTTSDSYENGDVILVGNKEYVRSGKTDSAAGTWVELGDESSFAQKTVSITGTGVLSGGGTLESDRTIAHNTSGVTAGTYATNASTTLTNGGTFNIPQVTVDTYGHITAASDVTLTLPTITANNAKLKFSDGTNTSDVFTADAATDTTFTFGAGDNWIETTIDQSGLTIGHKGPGTGGANITAVTTPSALKVAYDAKGHITSSSALTAADVTATTGAYGGSSNVSTVQGALDNLAAAVAEGTNGMLSTSATGQPKTPNGQSMSNDIVLHDIAKTGNTDDLIQGLTILLDCGTATTNTDTPTA